MSINNISSNKELSCYTKIIDCYLQNRNDTYQREMCKNNSIIKLINISECRNIDNFIRNALLLVLSLYDNKPADLYHNYGSDIESCSETDKEMLLAELKKEFL